MTDEALVKQLAGYGLTTALIIYRLPDFRSLLQTYVWQEYDVFPDLPRLNGFILFWRDKLEGPIYQVEVAHRPLIGPAEIRVRKEFRLN